jgi:hypothetical protein
VEVGRADPSNRFGLREEELSEVPPASWFITHKPDAMVGSEDVILRVLECIGLVPHEFRPRLLIALGASQRIRGAEPPPGVSLLWLESSHQADDVAFIGRVLDALARDCSLSEAVYVSTRTTGVDPEALRLVADPASNQALRLFFALRRVLSEAFDLGSVHFFDAPKRLGEALRKVRDLPRLLRDELLADEIRLGPLADAKEAVQEVREALGLPDDFPADDSDIVGQRPGLESFSIPAAPQHPREPQARRVDVRLERPEEVQPGRIATRVMGTLRTLRSGSRLASRSRPA